VGGPSIAIVGGGVFAPRLCEVVSQALPPEGTLRLFARRPDRLARIAAYASGRVRRGWSAVAARSLAECVDGAQAVILLVRVGGLEARAHDEQFPERFGLVGDEGLGPGGFANAFRTAPALAELAATLRSRCPRALVCNLVAPLGLTTRLLVDEGLDAVGVCELPAVTLGDLAGGDVERVSFEYVGLNHLGWFWNLRRDGQDLLPDAAARGLVDDRVLARFGAAPLRYYYEVFDRVAGQRLGHVRRTGRAQALMQLADRALDAFSSGAADDAVHAERPTPWFDRALVPLLAARWGGAPYRGFLDIANAGGATVPWLPAGGVVEVAVHATTSLTVTRPGECPPAVRSFLRAIAEAEALAYRAARSSDAATLGLAMAALPLDIPREQIGALVDAALSPVMEVRS
jgi:6-phospho-beta-glucosidase